MNDWNYPFSPDDWQACMKVLQHLAREPYDAPELDRMKTLVTKIYKQAKKIRQKASQIEDGIHDRALQATTERVRQEIPGDPDSPELSSEELRRPKACYVCRQLYTRLHSFYHRLCPDCAVFNYAQREENIDLSGRIAIVTGGRIKVGLATALKLLRCGARVIVTSRFPANAATVFAAEPDYAGWQERLEIAGLDFCELGRLEAWIGHLNASLSHLDILVNNAAQTLWRPPEYYASLQAVEARLLPELTQRHLLTAGENAPVALPAPIPQEPPDPRPENSWSLELEAIPAREMLEAQVVNAVAPAMLCAGLKPLLQRSPHPRRFIVNVASAEGQFSYPLKPTTHAHTNMAKAGLNMLTRTSAAAYARDGIYMSAVDVGWISPETPEPLTQAKQATGFVPPLDAVDAAARILHPIRHGLSEAEAYHGVLLKDYAQAQW